MKSERKTVVDKHVLIQTDVWDEFEDFLNGAGLNFTSCINLFVRQCIIRQALPFEVLTYAPASEKREEVSTESSIYQQEEVMDDMSALDIVSDNILSDDSDDLDDTGTDGGEDGSLSESLTEELAIAGVFD